MAFDENEKHSFAQCELVRILSTTVTRSNTEFAKLSFDNISNPLSYISECYMHLWKEWAENKIYKNDILFDINKWDTWMLNYYNNCKNDYFNTIYEMYTLILFHSKSLKGDFSWICKNENINLILNHHGMVSTKLVNKLDYLLKKHNFGSLNLQPKTQKYRTRKRGGCKFCNQIRDVKKMLEKQVLPETNDNINNDNNNNNNNKQFNINALITQSNNGMNVNITNNNINNINSINNNNDGINRMSPISLLSPISAKSATRDEWKTTEIISSHGGSVNCGSSHCSSTSNEALIINNININNNNNNTQLLNENSEKNKEYELQNNEYNIKTAMESISYSDEDIEKLLVFTPTPPPPESSIFDIDDLVSFVNDPNTNIPNAPKKQEVSLHNNNKAPVTKLTLESLNAPEFIMNVSHSGANSINTENSDETGTNSTNTMNSDHSGNLPKSINEMYTYDINSLFYNALNLRSKKNNDSGTFDSSIKERHFDVVNMNQCQYGMVYEFDKPIVLCNMDENSYLYYIPREYLCNAKCASQFALAIENLTNWDKNLQIYARESAWYINNNDNNNNNNNNNNISFEYNDYNENHIGKCNNYPNWLKSIEQKVLSMLEKFPQLSHIVQNNIPNSCFMNKFDNGLQWKNMYNMNEKYFNTLKENYGSVNMCLGETRTLALGSIIKNHIFGLNIKSGDVFVISGQLDCYYKYGMSCQANVNNTTMTLTFAKISQSYINNNNNNNSNNSSNNNISKGNMSTLENNAMNVFNESSMITNLNNVNNINHMNGMKVGSNIVNLTNMPGVSFNVTPTM